jgi:hypothetical protein
MISGLKLPPDPIIFGLREISSREKNPQPLEAGDFEECLKRIFRTFV